MSDVISVDMKENAEGLIFRDSVIDAEGNVQCILKWKTLEDQQTFHKQFMETTKDKPEIMENFAKIADMSTMTKETFNVV